MAETPAMILSSAEAPVIVITSSVPSLWATFSATVAPVAAVKASASVEYFPVNSPRVVVPVVAFK